MPNTYGTGFAYEGEQFYVRGPRAAFWDALRPVPCILYCHGATSTTALVTDGYEIALLRLLARRYLVLVSEWGGDLFGNDEHLARVQSGIDALRGSGYNIYANKVGLVGLSMGGGLSLAFARNNPEQVAFMAGIIPAMSWKDLHDRDVFGLADDLDAAYGGVYDDDVDGPLHSPIRFATTLDPDLPVHLWTTSNDTATPPAIADAFAAQRPQTGRSNIGAYGHGAAPAYYASAAVTAFAESHIDRTA